MTIVIFLQFVVVLAAIWMGARSAGVGLWLWGAVGLVNELPGDDPKAFLVLPTAERYARFFEHFVDGLRARPLPVEIFAAGILQRNELVALLEAEREAWGEEASRLVGGADFARRPELRGLTILLVAGVQYLLVRARHLRIFGGIEVKTDEG